MLWDEGKLYLVMEYMDTDLMHYCRDTPLDLPTIKVRAVPLPQTLRPYPRSCP